MKIRTSYSLSLRYKNRHSLIFSKDYENVSKVLQFIGNYRINLQV